MAHGTALVLVLLIKISPVIKQNIIWGNLVLVHKILLGPDPGTLKQVKKESLTVAQDHDSSHAIGLNTLIIRLQELLQKPSVVKASCI